MIGAMTARRNVFGVGKGIHSEVVSIQKKCAWMTRMMCIKYATIVKKSDCGRQK
jgi:hypothetical protein